MLSFGLVAEGSTDMPVLSNILKGIGFDEEPNVNELQPMRDATDQNIAFGGWYNVIEYCRSNRLSGDLEVNDYVILHIDTDMCEQPHYNVSRKDPNGVTRSPEQLANTVSQMLQYEIASSQGMPFLEACRPHLIFAIAVDSIECWLLPLYADIKQQNATLNCIDKLQRALNKDKLRKTNLSSKRKRDYFDLSYAYAKPKVLALHEGNNPSLHLFVNTLKALK